MAATRLGREAVIRTAHCLDSLSAEQRQSARKLQERVIERQYHANGFQPPASDTLDAYFGLKRDLAIDPRRDIELPFLLALAYEFPRCENNYFHVAPDLLFGSRESTAIRVFRGRLFANAAIDFVAQSDPAGAERMRDHNSRQKRQRGRPGRASSPVLTELAFAHRCMLRLPPPFRAALFEELRGGLMLARRYGHAQDEIRAVSGEATMDGLGALLALMRESAQIGDYRRFLLARAGTTELARRIREVKTYRRFGEVLGDSVDSFCRAEWPRLYSPAMAFQADRPASWRDPDAIPRIASLILDPRPGDQPGAFQYDPVLNPTLLQRAGQNQNARTRSRSKKAT